MSEKSKFVINSDHFYLDPMLLWVLCIRLVTQGGFNHVASIDVKMFNSHRIGLEHQHGRRFIFLNSNMADVTSCENVLLSLCFTLYIIH